MSIVTATIDNITYDFTLRCNGTKLCLRIVNGDGPWRNAFAFIHFLTDDSTRHDDALYNIMMELTDVCNTDEAAAYRAYDYDMTQP